MVREVVVANMDQPVPNDDMEHEGQPIKWTVHTADGLWLLLSAHNRISL